MDKLLPIDLIKKTNSNPDIPPTIIGAIDVALLTVIFSLLSDLFSKFFSKPIELTIKLKPNNSSSDTANIKLPIEDIDKIESTEISLKITGKIEKFYKTIRFIFRGIKIKILWHAQWLSIDHNLAYEGVTPKQKAGELCFDILETCSEGDDIIDFPTVLYCLPNNPKSRKVQGKITAKVEVNYDNKFICFCLSGILNSLINLKVETCKIFIEKGS
ncbi:hypothetical protein ACWGPZ_26775 [Priestia megaterium]